MRMAEIGTVPGPRPLRMNRRRVQQEVQRLQERLTQLNTNLWPMNETMAGLTKSLQGRVATDGGEGMGGPPRPLKQMDAQC